MTKNNLKDFFNIKDKNYCSVCGKEIKNIFKVNIRSSNPLHRYKGSGRPVVYTYNLKLCSKHFKKIKNMLDKFLQETI